MKRIIAPALFLLISVSGFAMAASEQPESFENPEISIVPNSFETAINSALAKRIELTIESRKMNIEKARVKEAAGEFYPRLDMTWNLDRLKQFDEYTGIDVVATFMGEDIPISLKRAPKEYIVSSSLESTYTLYEGGKVTAGYDKAKAQETLARTSREITRQSIMKETAISYWELKKAQTSYMLAKLEDDLADSELDVAKNQWKHNQISEIDKNASLLERMNAQRNLDEAKWNLRTNYSNYLDVLELYNDKAVSNDPSDFYLDSPSLEQMSEYLSSLIEIRNPEMRMAQIQIEMAKADKKIAQSDLYPKVDFYLSYTMIGRGDSSFNDSFSDFKRANAAAGLVLDWNLYEGGSSSGRIAQANEKKYEAQNSLQKTKRDYEKSLLDTKIKMAQLNERLSLEKQIAELKKSQEKVAMDQLSAGEISEIDFKKVKHERLYADIQVEFTQIELALVFIDQILIGND